MTMQRLLQRIERFPRVPLTQAPTPIDAAPRLSARLGIELLIKRDDCTGLAFGGNKARQLEFYMGAARARQADTILITGAVQSNFVRMAAAAAAKLGMAAYVQLEERVPGVDATYRSSGNVLLDDLFGAHRLSYPEGEDEAGADRALTGLADKLTAEGRTPYVIPLAPGHPPLGALGYVLCAAEIAGQRSDIDAIVIASGSGATHAGLLFGLRALGDETPVYGVCVRRDARLQRPRIARHCEALAKMLDLDVTVDDSDIKLEDSVLAPGYGQLNQATVDAIRLTARDEGLLLDPAYTGKVMAGLIALAQAGRFAADARVLFVHTGGTPALFGYETELRAWLARTSDDT